MHFWIMSVQKQPTLKLKSAASKCFLRPLNDFCGVAIVFAINCVSIAIAHSSDKNNVYIDSGFSDTLGFRYHMLYYVVAFIFGIGIGEIRTN